MSRDCIPCVSGHRIICRWRTPCGSETHAHSLACALACGVRNGAAAVPPFPLLHMRARAPLRPTPSRHVFGCGARGYVHEVHLPAGAHNGASVCARAITLQLAAPGVRTVHRDLDFVARRQAENKTFDPVSRITLQATCWCWWVACGLWRVVCGLWLGCATLAWVKAGCLKCLGTLDSTCPHWAGGFHCGGKKASARLLILRGARAEVGAGMHQRVLLAKTKQCRHRTARVAQLSTLDCGGGPASSVARTLLCDTEV